MELSTTSLMFSKTSDNWQTPREFFQRYHDEFNFTVDGAADASNHLLPRWMGPDSENGSPDALAVRWTSERVWLNPPYSQCAGFLRKAAQEAQYGNPSVVLIPSRTDTRYFHDYVYNRHAHRWLEWVKRVDFVKGRLKFKRPGEDTAKNSAPFPSLVIVMKGF